MQNLEKLFERLKAVSIWQRIFGWSLIDKMCNDAREDFMELKKHVSILEDNILDLVRKNIHLEQQNAENNKR